MESEDWYGDTRNKRGGRVEEDLNKIGNGLNMAKKSSNFKEMAKAHKRMMQKRKQQIEAKRIERTERRDEIQQKVWHDEGCELDKKMNKKIMKEEKMMEKKGRKKMNQELADAELKGFEEIAKNKKIKNK